MSGVVQNNFYEIQGGKKMKTHLQRIIALLVIVSMLLAACGTAEPEPTVVVEPTQPPVEEPTVAPPAEGGVVEATPGQAVDMVLLPKFVGNLVFDQAHDGAKEAHAELQNTGELQFLGPTADNSVAGQIEIVTNATTQGVNAIMISNNAGDQIAPAAKAARDAGLTVVTWDSPIPSSEGEQLFIAQVDFDETGKVMADMALNILGEDGGKFAVLSASPDAANQNAWIAALQAVLEKDSKYASLELLDIVYGNDQSEDSYNQALALVSKYPDMELIMAPTTIGIASAAKAMQDEGLCDTVKISGLGLPSEMVEFTLNGCAPEFALWSFVDLGYLTYYTSYMLATGALKGEEGETFNAGRMGTYAIEKDPTRDAGLRVLMGPFTVYDASNVEAGAGIEGEAGGEVVKATPGQTVDMVLLPKFVGNLVFDQAHNGAKEAHTELANAGTLEFLGPTADNSVAGQIEIVTNATTQGVNAIMISNNAGDQIAPAAKAARDAGLTVVTWDSPIPSSEGEQLFIAQVDFDETGVVMADMALEILGEDGGKFAVLSASPDAANQNAWIAALQAVLEKDSKYASLELLDIVYGNDQSEDSYNQALALVSKYPDMELIMAPTTIGIASAAKAMQDEGLCDTVKISGLGLPSEMVEFTLNGCAPKFALWSFVDLGYLTYYTTYLLATDAIEGKVGERFEAGRMGTYTIEKDPTRDAGLRILMGPFTVYDATNVEDAAE
jgi:rhamnose transport system substrate-binding protein